MFGIFTKKETKIGQEIANNLIQAMGIAFAAARESLHTIFWIDENRNFKPPYDFYDDPYIIGFIDCFIVVSMNFLYPQTKGFSDEQKGEIIHTVIHILGRSESLRLKQNYIRHLDLIKSGKMDPEFSRGQVVALEGLALVFDLVPLLEERTPELDVALRGETQEIQSFLYSRATIVKYIKEKYRRFYLESDHEPVNRENLEYSIFEPMPEIVKLTAFPYSSYDEWNAAYEKAGNEASEFFEYADLDNGKLGRLEAYEDKICPISLGENHAKNLSNQVTQTLISASRARVLKNVAAEKEAQAIVSAQSVIQKSALTTALAYATASVEVTPKASDDKQLKDLQDRINQMKAKQENRG